jgi:hypothetical protein
MIKVNHHQSLWQLIKMIKVILIMKEKHNRKIPKNLIEIKENKVLQLKPLIIKKEKEEVKIKDQDRFQVKDLMREHKELELDKILD